MNEKNPLLLPSGFYDLLPPDARKESAAVARLLATFESFGYAQITPPLMEFETSLFAGRGEALAPQTLRVMDPLSQLMMGFRADITLQAARIASSRLGSQPRPLRLCYAGPILQTKPEPLKNERQLTQAGIELIGADSVQADAEVMIVAAEALVQLGIDTISIDITLPGLIGELCPEAHGNQELQLLIKNAVSRKDSAMIASLPVASSQLLATLANSAGALDKALAMLTTLGIPQAQAVREVAERVRRNCPGVELTLDPIEYLGFDYHQGISFSLFAKGLRNELGRGGRYMAHGEGATGFTLYVTYLLQVLGAPKTQQQLLVPLDIPADTARALRGQGWATCYALANVTTQEASRLGYNALWNNGKIETL
jgi:ATP phosphoribosyltransferase regulatory subunit